MVRSMSSLVQLRMSSFHGKVVAGQLVQWFLPTGNDCSLQPRYEPGFPAPGSKIMKHRDTHNTIIPILSLVSGAVMMLLFGIAFVHIRRHLLVDKQAEVPDEESLDEFKTSSCRPLQAISSRIQAISSRIWVAMRGGRSRDPGAQSYYSLPIKLSSTLSFGSGSPHCEEAASLKTTGSSSSTLSFGGGYTYCKKTAVLETTDSVSVALDNYEDSLEPLEKIHSVSIEPDSCDDTLNPPSIELSVLSAHEEHDLDAMTDRSMEQLFDLWRNSHIMLLVLDSNLRILVWSSGMSQVGARVLP